MKSLGAQNLSTALQGKLWRGAGDRFASEPMLSQRPRILPDFLTLDLVNSQTARPFFVPDFGNLLFCD